MKFFSDLLLMLAFREEALRSMAERSALAGGAVIYCAGFLAYALVRNSVYAQLPEIMGRPSGPVASFFSLNLIQTVLFVMVVYIPAIIILSNAIAATGLSLRISGKEYGTHASTLLVLWGLLYLISAPIQWLVPHFLIIGMFEISFGMLVRSLLIVVYTVWAIRQLHGLSLIQSSAAFALSLLTLILYYLLISF